MLLQEARNVLELREKIKNFLVSQGMIKGHSGSTPRMTETSILSLADDGSSSSAMGSSVTMDSYSSHLAQPDSFYGSYDSTGSLVQPTAFMPSQHFTEPNQCPCSPLVAANYHALAPDYHAYPPLSQHQPVPINHHSSYSELSANVAYISQTTPSTSQASLSSSSRRETSASKSFQDLQSWSPDVVPSHHRTSSVRFEHNVWDQTSGTQHLVQVLPWSEPESLSGSEAVPKLKKGTEKKQTLKCFFCRERKIACGRPAEGSDDHTCK